MLIHSASQLLTLAGGTQRGEELGQLNIITDGAVNISDGLIREVGKSAALRTKYGQEAQVNARGRVVMPGFVDAHTHLVWAGERAAEFAMRLAGKSYLEILEAGGGILSTVKATRNASRAELMAESNLRAKHMFEQGTTTAEAKSGYGLEMESELRQMEVMLALDEQGPLEVVPTFLGAHAVPPEYKDAQTYSNEICAEMLPALKEWWQEHAAGKPLPFVDVFCERGAFNLAQTRQILTRAKELGFPLKVHADEFENLGGAALAAELGAASADHLVKTSPADMKALGTSGTAAVGLPCTPFGLAEQEYTPAKALLRAGCLIALGSDLNPGTAWGGNMQFVLALACRYMGLTPAQAIAASTINAAAAIQRETTIGSLKAGKQADLLILKVSDYRQLGYRFGENLVQNVVKKGRLYPLAEGMAVPC